MKKTLFLLTLLSFAANAQNDDAVAKRLQALRNNAKTYYNIDGVNFKSETLYELQFNEKGLRKAYKKFEIKETDAKTQDDSLALPNLYVHQTAALGDGVVAHQSIYLMPNDNNQILSIAFESVNKHDRNFERHFVRRILKKEIPQLCFTPFTIDSISFAGRKIRLGSSCYWTNINTVQCPYHGEMNWSLHGDLEDAAQTVQNQLRVTKLKKGFKILTEESIKINFEGTVVTAQKVVYDVTGVNGLLAGMSGAKSLTAYYVAAPVRGNFVSCVLSHWNNDDMGPDGLPALLAEVMQLQP